MSKKGIYLYLVVCPFLAFFFPGRENWGYAPTVALIVALSLHSLSSVPRCNWSPGAWNRHASLNSITTLTLLNSLIFIATIVQFSVRRRRIGPGPAEWYDIKLLVLFIMPKRFRFGEVLFFRWTKIRHTKVSTSFRFHCVHNNSSSK